jgi:hypothetical protein
MPNDVCTRGWQYDTACALLAYRAFFSSSHTRSLHSLVLGYELVVAHATLARLRVVAKRVLASLDQAGKKRLLSAAGVTEEQLLSLGDKSAHAQAPAGAERLTGLRADCVQLSGSKQFTLYPTVLLHNPAAWPPSLIVEWPGTFENA